MDSISEHEDRFRAITERRIRDAVEAGEFDVKTGPDEKLDLEENPYIPEDWRLAFRVLKNGNYKPDFVELADEIDAELEEWRRAADNHFAYLRARLAAVAGHPSGIRRMREEIAGLKIRHQRASEQHARRIAAINHKIHRYNATVPAPILMRGTLAAEAEMQRFADRLPAYLNY